MNKLLLGIFFTFVSFVSYASEATSCGEANGAASVKDRLVYPLESRKLREEGKTILKVFVDKTGHLVEMKLHESSGFSRLDEAAMESVKSFCFIPARRAGEPLGAWVLVPITFKLNE